MINRYFVRLRSSARGANEAVCAIGKFEMSLTVPLIIFSEALLPVADWVRTIKPGEAFHRLSYLLVSLKDEPQPELDLPGRPERVDPCPTPTRSMLWARAVVPLIWPAAPVNNPLSEAAGRSKFAKLNRL